ncbi:AzlC family ABC transporter permease [Pantoea eucalypti]|uniref:AzlC family ABC transporter permease n=1 Tax=Pantoea eucalypti TaxID=470933 RepID=UPI003EE7D2C0
MNSITRSDSFLQGVKDASPLLMAITPYAFILGAQASRSGLTLPETGLMTALNFAGGSEFAAIQLWHDPLPVLTIILLTFLINSRHIIMGAALTPYIKHLPRRQILPALFFMADERWAVTYAKMLKTLPLYRLSSRLPWLITWGPAFPLIRSGLDFQSRVFLRAPCLETLSSTVLLLPSLPPLSSSCVACGKGWTLPSPGLSA